MILRNKICADELLIHKVVQESQVDNARVLITLDDKNGFGSDARGGTFAAQDFDIAVEKPCYCRYLVFEDVLNRNTWNYGVYIPKRSAERWQQYGPYFVWVLAHELEHVQIMQIDLAFHRFSSWIYDWVRKNWKTAEKMGVNVRLNKNEFPSELHCNKRAMATVKKLFTQTEIDTCFDKLMEKETCLHKKVISLVKKIEPNFQRTTSVKPLIHETEKFCAGAIPTIHKAWEKARKSEPLACRFDLQSFLPVNVVPA